VPELAVVAAALPNDDDDLNLHHDLLDLVICRVLSNSGVRHYKDISLQRGRYCMRQISSLMYPKIQRR